MDTTDKDIIFYNDGTCCHCVNYEKNINPHLNELKKNKLSSILDKIKKSSNNEGYNCVLGLSGGLDSSFVALKVYEYGLNPIVVHVDAGWNSELAVNNIERIIKYCNWNLNTIVIDWEEMKDVQLAYLKSGIANQDVPQDHIFIKSLLDFANKNSLKYLISGGNLESEGIFPKNWHGSSRDGANIRDIHKKYGKRKLKSYKTIKLLDYYFVNPFVYKYKTVRLLDYLGYNKNLASKELADKIGWRIYGRKHGESIFTKWFQNYYLIKRFNYDKRLPHYSSLIMSSQMTRAEALSLMKEPLYDQEELKKDTKYICQKLDISTEDLERYMNIPIRNYNDYKNWDSIVAAISKFRKLYEKFTGRKIRIYS